jgi:hypothetical protein
MRMEELDTPRSRAVNVTSHLSIGISVALFVLCLFLPAYTVFGKQELHSTAGFQVLIIGWLGILDSMLEWYANPLLVISWFLIAFRIRTVGLIFSAGSLYLALSFLDRAQMILDESPNYGDIVSRDLGYWVWIASISFSIAAAVIPLAYNLARKR